MADVCAVDRHHVERPAVFVQTRDDERPSHLLAWEPVERLDTDSLDRQSGEQREAPFAVLQGTVR